MLESDSGLYTACMCNRQTKTIVRRGWLQRKHVACLIVVLSTTLTAVVQAQAQEPVQLPDWRAANDAVGKFLRGHIDIVRAESRSGSVSPVAPDAPNTNKGDAISLDQAKKLALRAKATDLFLVPGQSVVERQAQAIAVTELLFEVESVWLGAVGHQVLLQLQQDATEAATIASELASRMGVIGNWGADRVLAVQMQAKAEELKLLNAQNAARQSLLQLESILMTPDVAVPPSLPALRGLAARADLRASSDELASERLSRIPNYATRLVELERWQTQASAEALAQWTQYSNEQIDAAIKSGDSSVLVIDPTKLLWNHSVKEALHSAAYTAELQASTRNTVAQAQAAVISSHQQAMLLANDFVPLAMQAEEEAVYQYNGMFISTWNLLEQYRARVQVQIAAVNAQMLFLQTDAAFKAYMAGADYRPPANALGADLGASSAGGH